MNGIGTTSSKITTIQLQRLLANSEYTVKNPQKLTDTEKNLLTQ